MSEANTPARPVLPTEQKDAVTLREFEQRLSEFRAMMDERTRYEREILSTRENLIKEAHDLQAAEYERRLTELNHAHELAAANWRMSLPREMFEAHLQEFLRWRDSVNASLATGTQGIAELKQLRATTDGLDKALRQAEGALTLLRFMGFAGVFALIIGILRLAGVIK